MHAHDAIHHDHDEGFGRAATFPTKALAGAALKVWRADRGRHLEIDAVLPWESPKRERHVIIHRGHARALRPPAGAAGPRLAAEAVRA